MLNVLNQVCGFLLIALAASGMLWVGCAVARARVPLWKLAVLAAVATAVLWICGIGIGKWAFLPAVAVLIPGRRYFVNARSWKQVCVIVPTAVLLFALYVTAMVAALAILNP